MSNDNIALNQLVFIKCPNCGSPETVRLPEDWQTQVLELRGTYIPVIGCGNPWHYVFPKEEINE